MGEPGRRSALISQVGTSGTKYLLGIPEVFVYFINTVDVMRETFLKKKNIAYQNLAKRTIWYLFIKEAIVTKWLLKKKADSLGGKLY